MRIFSIYAISIQHFFMRYSKMHIKIGGGKCSYWKQEHLTFCTQNLQNFRYFFILNQDLCFCPNTVGVFYQYYIAQTQAIENPLRWTAGYHRCALELLALNLRRSSGTVVSSSRRFVTITEKRHFLWPWSYISKYRDGLCNFFCY